MADVGIEQLKEDIQSNINTNNNQEITGAVLQGQLLDTVDTLKGYTDDHVSVSQNISTGHTDINIGGDSYPVASVQEVSNIRKVVDGNLAPDVWFQGNISNATGKFTTQSTRVTNSVAVICGNSKVRVVCSGDVRMNTVQRYKDGYSPVDGGVKDTDWIAETLPSTSSRTDITFDFNATYPNLYITFARVSSASAELDTATVAANVLFTEQNSILTKLEDVESSTEELDARVSLIEDGKEHFILSQEITPSSNLIFLKEYDYGKNIAIRLIENQSNAVIKAQARRISGDSPYVALTTDWTFFESDIECDRLYIFVSTAATISGIAKIEVAWGDAFIAIPFIKAYNPVNEVVKLGNISYISPNVLQAIWLTRPIYFDENTFVTLHTDRTDLINEPILLYAVYSNDDTDRKRILPNALPLGETIIQIPSYGRKSLYGILFYNPNGVDYSLTASLVLTARSNSVKFFDEAEKRANYVPSYYFQNDYLEKRFDVINKYLRKNILTGDAFYFITDTHWEYNRKRSPAIIRELNKRLNIPKIFHGGDLYHNSPVIDNIETDCINSYRSALGSNRVYSCQGNHEYIGDEKYGDTFVKTSMYVDKAIYGGSNKQYYYVDNEISKIRYIILYVYGERIDGNYTNGYNDTAQMNWLRDVALNVNIGWSILIFTHYIGSPSAISNEYVFPNGFSNVAGIINDYNGNGKIIAVITGHTHRDFVLLETLNVPIIITTCDHNMNFSYGTVNDFDNLQTPRTSDTINEQAFDAVILDKENYLLHFVRIGSQADNKMNLLTNNEQVSCRSIYCNEMEIGDNIELPTYLADDVEWESSDDSIATVQYGVVSCLASGCVRITATGSAGEKQSFYMRIS